MSKYIGVLALQGAFARHIQMFTNIGVDARPFRELSELSELAGLVIPGGESTTIGMLLERRNLVDPLRQAIIDGLPVFGTCAGAILLARDIEDSDQLRLGTMDISIRRNAYGSQVDSFETRLDVSDEPEGLQEEIDGVFIRAPLITRCGKAVRLLASFDGKPVLVRQERMLAGSFHPELSNSTAVHRYFAERVCGLSQPGKVSVGTTKS